MPRLDSLKGEIRELNSSITKLLTKAARLASRVGDEGFVTLISKEKDRIKKGFASLHESLSPEFEKQLKKRTQRLQKNIDELRKSHENLVSDNYLLEYKKKDLLLVTQKLEEAYDEITLKNKELMFQQQKISDQTEKLNAIHEQILEKNRELEQQKEALLDQSDYLHEANQAITTMHEEVQQQKAQIEKKNEELLILNNEKNNLIGIVAHDLKSPLNQIKGLLSIMKTDASGLNADVVKYIEMMEGSANRLTSMIAKILDVEAIEAKQINLNLEEVNLSDVLDELIKRFRIVASRKAIVLHPTIKHGTCVNVDRAYVDQVLENLLSNAIKFSPENRNIFVHLACDNGKAIVEIRDEGPGLTEDDKKKLFGKYQKLSARPTGDETSTGLGLSIVKKFVDAMQGDIWCESEAGKGASFFVAFPMVEVRVGS